MSVLRKLAIRTVALAAFAGVALSSPRNAWAVDSGGGGGDQCGVCDPNDNSCSQSHRQAGCNAICGGAIADACDSPVDVVHCTDNPISSWNCG